VAGDGIDEFGFVHIMFLWTVINSDTEFKKWIIVDFVEINEDLYAIDLCYLNNLKNRAVYRMEIGFVVPV
jgi:hypothetical protein